MHYTQPYITVQVDIRIDIYTSPKYLFITVYKMLISSAEKEFTIFDT